MICVSARWVPCEARSATMPVVELVSASKPWRGAVRLSGVANTGEDGDDALGFCRDVHPKLVGFLALHTADVGLAEELAQESWSRCSNGGRRFAPATT
jgi:hypothetical protein